MASLHTGNSPDRVRRLDRLCGAAFRSDETDRSATTIASQRLAVLTLNIARNRWIAYQSDESGVPQVHVTKFVPEQPSEAARVQVSNDGGIGPVWSPNRKELLYRTSDGRVMTAAYHAAGETFTAEKPRRWVETRLAVASSYYSFEISPDGKRLVTYLAAGEAKPKPMSA